MKMLKLTLCTALMSVLYSASVCAANPGSDESNNGVNQPDTVYFGRLLPMYGSFPGLGISSLPERTFDRWFVSVGGGVGRLMAEDSRKLPFWKDAQPMLTLSAGAWISPVWGIRAQVGGGRLLGYAIWNEGTNGDPGYGGGHWFIGEAYPHPIGRDKANTYLETAGDADPVMREFVKNNYFDLDKPRTGKDGSKGYNYQISYFNVMADLMLNLNHAIGGYSGHDDFLQVIPFAGLGWAHTRKDGILPKVNSIAVRGGLNAELRLAKRFRFNVESYVMMVPEVFDRYVGSNQTQDAVFALTGGFTYKFGKAKVCQKGRYNYPSMGFAPIPVEPKTPVIVAECPGVQISGLVYDTYQNPLPNATVFVYDTREQTVKVLRSGESGGYTTLVSCGAPLIVKAVKSGYLDDCLSYVASDNPTGTVINQRIPMLRLARLEKNTVIVLENIHYDFDRWNIRPDAAAELDRVVQFLRQNPDIDVELGSHTDSRGSYAYNDKLSERRSKSAVAYITARGVSPKRITATWYGERRLLEDCPDGVWCSEAQHQLNRRTELTIVDDGALKPQTEDPWGVYVTGETYRVEDLPAGFFDRCDPDKR